jgi:hypothetical protein
MKRKKTVVSNTTYGVDDMLQQGDLFAARCQTRTTRDLYCTDVLWYCYVACYAKNKQELLEAMRKRLRDDCGIDLYGKDSTDCLEVAATYVARKNTAYAQEIRKNYQQIVLNVYEQKQAA